MFLMGSTRGRILVLGVNPYPGVRSTEITDGDCLWDLSLGKRTGDGEFDGETFWVGCGWFFLGGSGEGKRNYRSRTAVCFRRTTRGSKQPFLCYILYNEQWRFRFINFRQPDDLLHTLKTVKGLLHLVPSRTPRSSGYGVLSTCGLCYMIFLLYV